MAKKRRIGNETHPEPEFKLEPQEPEVKVEPEETESEDDLAKLLEQISKQQLIEIIRSVSTENKRISQEIQNTKALQQPAVKESVNQMVAASDLASSSSGPVDVSEWQMVVKRRNSLREETLQRKIFVGNVITSLPESSVVKLHSFFSQYGEIEEGPLGFDKFTGKPRGFAIFTYKTVQGATKALEQPIKDFYGHPLYCQRANGGASSSNSPTKKLPLLKNNEWNGVASTSSSPRAGAGAAISAQNGVLGHRGLSDQGSTSGVVKPYRIRKKPIQGPQLDDSYFGSEKLKYGSNGTTRNLHSKNDGCNYGGGVSRQACVGAGFSAQNWGMGHDQGGINAAAERYGRGKEPVQGRKLKLATPCQIGPYFGHDQDNGLLKPVHPTELPAHKFQYLSSHLNPHGTEKS